MPHYVTAFLAAFKLAAPIAIEMAVAVGLFGSALEAFGVFLQRFANTKVQAVGRFFARAGKTLEAVGTDVPKLVANALGWAGRLSKMVGISLPGLLILVAVPVAWLACASAKPCPVTVEANYTAELAAACADAGSLAACKSYPALKAAHALEQEDAGCRVK